VFFLLSFSRRFERFADQGLKGLRIESLMLFDDTMMTRDDAHFSTIHRRYAAISIAIARGAPFFA
jgi:hypothetical protein